MVFTGTVVVVHRAYGEIAVMPFDTLDRLVLAHVEFIVLGGLPVIFQGLLPGGFLIGAGKRNVADLEQLGSGEKRHVAGIVVERIAQASLVDVRHLEAGALGLNTASQPGRAGTDDHHVERSHFRRMTFHVFRISRPAARNLLVLCAAVLYPVMYANPASLRREAT